jgi:NADH-quinone oxidoreductase subunit L
VAVALIGWLIADRLYRQKPAQPAQMAAALPGAYKLLANKYYVDEIYGATVVKPLLGFSKYVLGWVVDAGLLGGLAWLLGGIAPLPARFCNGGSRAICARMRRGWLRARRQCCCSWWCRGMRFGRLQWSLILKVAGH